MTKKVNVFDNLFDSHRIAPTRLLKFGWAVHTALVSANTNGKYTDLIAKLLTALNALKTELADIDENLGKQKNSTIGVWDFITGFADFMDGSEYTIARALGGKNTDGYRTLYPFGKSEYRQANHTTMPTLTTRVEKAANTYATALGTALSTEMQGFATGYTNAVNAQRLQQKNVRNDLAEKSIAFVQLQWMLTSAVHTVAAINLENVKASTAIFPFEMLYTQPKHKRLMLEETLAAGVAKMVLNRTFNTGAMLSCRNTSKSVSIKIWLTADATSAPTANAIIVKPNRSKIIKAPKLGDLNANTFLMIKNESDQYEGSISINIAGLSKLMNEKEMDKKTAEQDVNTDMKVVKVA